MLERLSRGWEQSKIRSWLQKEMPGNASWRVLITPDLWLCPICLEAGAQFRKADDLYEAAAIHLTQMCEKYKAGQKDPVVPLDKLTATARYLCAEERVQIEPAWQQRNRQGLWFCPYCVKETNARLGPKGQADRSALEAIARHLIGCPAWENGHGKAKPAQDVRQVVQRADLFLETLELTRKKLGDDPVWQVTSSRGRFVCPFCRHIVGSIEVQNSIFVPEATIHAVTTHLATDCESFGARLPQAHGTKELQEAAANEELFGDPKTLGGSLDLSAEPAGPKPVEAMDRNARLLWAKEQILRTKAWQQHTAEGQWFCPFCARETDAHLPLDGKINNVVIERIYDHVDNCFAFEHGRGKLKPIDVIAAAVSRGNAMFKAAAQVAQKISASAHWRVRDPEGYWVCPYCRQAIQQIPIATEVQLKKSAPNQIARHMIENCAAYKDKVAPATTVAELEAIFKKKVEPAHQIVADRTPIPEDLMRQINEEMASVKAQSGVSNEMKKSLESAKKTQMQMLPDLPKIPGLDFGVIFKACSVVAGDFYDFIRINPDELGILMGDVSGHGIEAGMVMALVRKVINIHARGRTSPKDTLMVSNPEIYPDIDRRTFITCMYCVLNEKTRMLKVARAGHNPLILFNPARTPAVATYEPKGMALGMDKGPRFSAVLEEIEIPLQSGDMMFIYTDGLAEATNMAGEEFGIERIIELVQKYGKYEVEYLMHMTDLELTKFRGDKEMEDDITLLGFKIL